MRLTYVANVGDGLCIAIRTAANETAIIDCGSDVSYWNTKGSERAFSGLQRIINLLSTPNILLLSHFHLDHYSGLVYATSQIDTSPILPLNVEQIILPGIPEFSQSTYFSHALLTMNFRLLGDDTGIPQYELIQLITRLNNGVPPRPIVVYKGDHLSIGGSNYSVLWPPRYIKENEPVASIVFKSLESFEEALEKDETTRKWYDYIREHYASKQYFEGEQKEVIRYLDVGNQIPIFEQRELPNVVVNANKLLRKAANRLSLSLYEDNSDFLFLGDLECSEIKIAVTQLVNSRRLRFHTLISPHHGTHWHETLFNIKSEHAVSSCGPRHYGNVRIEYDQISRRHSITSKCGDVISWMPEL